MEGIAFSSVKVGWQVANQITRKSNFIEHVLQVSNLNVPKYFI